MTHFIATYVAGWMILCAKEGDGKEVILGHILLKIHVNPQFQVLLHASQRVLRFLIALIQSG